jgi:hypothetical protein
MTFAFPIWLLGLLPWTGLVAYLLRGGGQRAKVPFLRLWPRPGIAQKISRYRLPPVHILLIIIAALMAILAASGPTWTVGTRAVGALTIVIDRGITLSGDARYHDLITRCRKMLGPQAAVTLVPVPGQSTEVTSGSWVDTADHFPPAAIDTSSQLNIAAVDRLRQTSGPVVVLTDQPLDLSDPRLFVIRPVRPPENIAITLMAATLQPHPQVMVRLQNQSSEKTVQLRVQSGSNAIERDVHFDGSSATEFVDLPALGDVVSAEVETRNDDIPADDAAWLTRELPGITLDVASGAPAELQRMAAVFSRHRPSGHHVLLTDQDLPAGVEGAVIVPGNGDDLPSVPLTSTDSSLTTGVATWPGPAAKIKPPADFQIVVQRGGLPLVAIHQAVPRQLWVNLNLTTWSRTTDFVVFFSNLFEWFRGSRSDEFVSTSPKTLGPEWKRIDERQAPRDAMPGLWPGLYRSVDGRLVAINAPIAPLTFKADNETIAVPASVFPAAHVGISLMPLYCWISLIAACTSVAHWPRKDAGITVSRSAAVPSR